MYTNFFEDLAHVKHFFKIYETEGHFSLYKDKTWFCPTTALCYIKCGKKYKSWEYHYAASEINLDIGLAYKIEKQCEGPYYELLKEALK